MIINIYILVINLQKNSMPFPLLLVVCIIGGFMSFIIIDTFYGIIKYIIQRRQVKTNPPLNSIEII